MNGWLYETHLHTAQGSACAVSCGKEYPRIYRELGFDGIFITDHFFQGNCAVPRSGSWESRVDAYMRGYYDALEEGEKCGIRVFFGIEQNYHGDEYLLYGLDRAFLMDHESIEVWPCRKLFDEVHAAGGCVVQAHPFRERGYIRTMHFALSGIDAVEGVNMGNKPHEDASALKYAQSLGYPVTCGGDIHSVLSLTPERVCGVRLEEKLECEKDYVNYLLSGKPICPEYPADRLSGVSPRLPLTPWETDEPLDLEKVLGLK